MTILKDHVAYLKLMGAISRLLYIWLARAVRRAIVSVLKLLKLGLKLCWNAASRLTINLHLHLSSHVLTSLHLSSIFSQVMESLYMFRTRFQPCILAPSLITGEQLENPFISPLAGCVSLFLPCLLGLSEDWETLFASQWWGFNCRSSHICHCTDHMVVWYF